MISSKRPLRIALIADELTSSSLSYEAELKHITSFNYKLWFRFWKPDFLFVESAWHGRKGSWKYQIASYPEHPERNNKKLAKVVQVAKRLGIPTVFWNKEDGVHFDRFIESAKLFDYIFTVDVNCIDKYKKIAPHAQVNLLSFPVQPRFHNFSGFKFQYISANFVGSYSHHIHEKRRQWQDLFFNQAVKTNLGLTVIDRNSARKSSIYRYPDLEGVNVLPAVSYPETAQIYKDYLVSLNVNTIENSETMYSRRLIEILACGGIAVTNPTPAVEKYFKDYCYVVENEEQLEALFSRLKKGPTEKDLKRARAGAMYVAKNHTWAHRLSDISHVLSISYAPLKI